MAISLELKEKIREKIDIVEIISQYISLKKTGANYKALCPFHEEKTPSFVVSPAKQIYHCFGCGAGGDVFTFLMKIENISFFKAAQKLAEIAGIALPSQLLQENSKEKEKREELFACNEEIAEFYHYILKHNQESQQARNYLSRRGLDTKTIEKFKIGFASPKYPLFREKKWKLEQLATLGLIKDRGEDLFVSRITFPIWNLQDRVAGFGARVIDEERTPKYINTPETPIFFKGKLLYGLNFARKSILENKKVIILEGYMDVISCHQAGLDYAIASLGTSLTEEHLKILSRFSSQLILIYDADVSGVNATLRAIDLILERGLNVKVVVLPPKYDPDSYIRSKGIEKFRELINNALSFIDFKIKILTQQFDISTTEGKISFVENILPLLAKIKNQIWLSEEIKKISTLLGVKEERIYNELSRLHKGKKLSFQEEKKELNHSFLFSVEESLISCLLNKPEFIPQVMGLIEPEELEGNYLAKIMEVIYQQYQKEKNVNINKIMDICENEEVNQIITKLGASPLISKNINFQLVEQLISELERKNLYKRYETLGLEIKVATKNKITVSKEKLQEYQNIARALKGI